MALILKHSLLVVGIILTLASFTSSSNLLTRTTYNQIDSTGKDTVYEFTGRLVEPTYIGSSCASFNYAVIQKFEVLETNYPDNKYKFVLIIQPCPEQAGSDFFRANSVYKMITTKTIEQKGFLIQNMYSGEHLPKFWSRDTKRVDN
jgi:hypothetical protein